MIRRRTNSGPACSAALLCAYVSQQHVDPGHWAWWVIVRGILQIGWLCVCLCFPTGDLGFSSLGLAISYYLSTCLLGSKISCLLPSPHLLLFFKLMSFLTLCCHFKGLEVTVQLDRMSSVWLCFSVYMLIEAQRVAK